MTASVAVAAPALAAPARASTSASTVKVAGGTTTIKIAGGAAKALTSVGVQVKIVKPAKLKGANVVMPVSSGSVDPRTGKGSITDKGGFTLAKGPLAVALTNITLDTRKRTLTASVHGARVVLASLSGGKVKRGGFNTTVSGIRVKATRLGAIALDTTFGTRAFRPGSLLATAAVAPTFKQISLQRGTARVVLNPAAVSALAQLKVSIASIPPAKIDIPTGTVSLGIAGGTLDLRSLDGTIRYQGGFNVAQIPLTGFVARLGKQDVVSAAGLDLANLQYPSKAASVHPATRTVTFRNVAVMPTAQAAGALNNEFFGGMPVISPGSQVATADLTAVAR